MGRPKLYCILPKEIMSWRRVCSKKQEYFIQVEKSTLHYVLLKGELAYCLDSAHERTKLYETPHIIPACLKWVNPQMMGMLPDLIKPCKWWWSLLPEWYPAHRCPLQTVILFQRPLLQLPPPLEVHLFACLELQTFVRCLFIHFICNKKTNSRFKP